MASLEAGDIDVDAWEEQMGTTLAAYHAAALMAGQGSPTLTPTGSRWSRSLYRRSWSFYRKFALEVQGEAEWRAGWNNRAAMYAEAMKVPYWRGATKLLPLPAMPAEGTQCRTRCKCKWRIEELDVEQGDYDCYWERGSGDSCQSVRAAGGQVGADPYSCRQAGGLIWASS